MLGTFEGIVFGLFVFACVIGLAIKSAVKKLGENEQVRDKAKEVGLGLLAKWFGGK